MDLWRQYHTDGQSSEIKTKNSKKRLRNSSASVVADTQ